MFPTACAPCCTPHLPPCHTQSPPAFSLLFSLSPPPSPSPSPTHLSLSLSLNSSFRTATPRLLRSSSPVLFQLVHSFPPSLFFARRAFCNPPPGRAVYLPGSRPDQLNHTVLTSPLTNSSPFSALAFGTWSNSIATWSPYITLPSFSTLRAHLRHRRHPQINPLPASIVPHPVAWSPPCGLPPSIPVDVATSLSVPGDNRAIHPAIYTAIPLSHIAPTLDHQSSELASRFFNSDSMPLSHLHLHHRDDSNQDIGKLAAEIGNQPEKRDGEHLPRVDLDMRTIGRCPFKTGRPAPGQKTNM